MRKIWLMLISVVLNFVACDMPATGGNPGEGSRPCNQKVLKVHADSLILKMTVNCPYEKVCDVKYYFYVAKLPDSLKGMCFGGGVEWKFESFDTSMVVKDWKSYPISLTSENHAKFSLIDINSVEKKYDIDLSEIINSYTVRGDSVDVNVMNGCSFKLYYCNKETVYGNQLHDGKYSFLATEGCDNESSYRCLWHNQGPSQKDDIDISATIYWKE